MSKTKKKQETPKIQKSKKAKETQPQPKGTYDATNIQVLEGTAAVRMRPAMYIGDTFARGLHHLVYEVVDNSIDEALAGHCTQIEVHINENETITVVDSDTGYKAAKSCPKGKSF